jgi:hypothetical protein
VQKFVLARDLVLTCGTNAIRLDDIPDAVSNFALALSEYHIPIYIGRLLSR